MKNFIIIILISIIIFLIIQIISGTFCHCSTVQCPSTTPLKEHIA